jgi:hypothetical protein
MKGTELAALAHTCSHQNQSYWEPQKVNKLVAIKVIVLVAAKGNACSWPQKVTVLVTTKVVVLVAAKGNHAHSHKK